MIEKHKRRIIKSNYVSKKDKIIRKAREKVAEFDLDMIIPDERDVYNTAQDKIKHIGLRILRCLEYLAKEYNFSFMLAYGTLLGAIRHDGFIPWDDDIDIFMTESEFNRLVEVSHNLPQGLSFFTNDVDFFKVMDRSSIVSMDGQRGVAVDIFILKESSRTKKYYFYNVHSQRNLFLKSAQIFPLSKRKFEELNLNVPSDFEHMLTELYGDYMKLPPMDQRVSHHSNKDSIQIASYGEILSLK